MVDILLIVSTLILVYLSAYALIFLGLSFFAFWPKSRALAFKTEKIQLVNRGPIAVLIPSHNEGEGLIDAIETVLRQDYPGLVEIYILLNDQKNNEAEIKALTKFYEFDASSVFNKNNRRIHLILSNFQAKKDKINFILNKLDQPFTAILDADHRPISNWLSSSVALFPGYSNNANISEIIAVQTRRRPLAVTHLAQIWDSAQNHLGNELFNNFLSRLGVRRGGKVFFTGTAALFKTAILKKYPLSDSVTEDTYLSYTLWCAGYQIIYNSHSASYEEVSPSFRDYVMRRRRWSAGHSRTFFKHLIKILKSPLPLLDKIILLGHGQFYLIPLAVWLLLSVYGYYFFRQLGTNFQFAVALAAFFIAGLLAYAFRQKNRRLYGDWLVAWLWLLPQLAIVSVYVYKFIGAENYYYILIFPYAKDWLIWHSVLIGLPLVAFLASFYFFKDSRQLKSLWLIPTYLITMALDIYASLLGFWDMLWGRSYWSRITRRNAYSRNLVSSDLSASLVTGQAAPRSRRLPYVLAVAGLITVVVLNDLLAVNNCGEIKKFLWPPLFLKPQSAVNLKISEDKKIAAPENLRLSIYAALTGGDGHFNLTYYIDDKFIGQKELKGALPLEPIKIIDTEYPLGWQKHKLEVRLQGQGADLQTTCNRRTAFSTVLKELRGSDLYINGEKFLVKGLIPSFMNGQIDLELADGFKQFQAIGINTIRLYHRANSALLRAAGENGLLVIDQPDRSTWDELDLTSDRQVNSYLERYQEMVTSHIGEPYLLWDGLGNEWELGGQTNMAQLVNLSDEIMARAAKEIYNWPSSYSTYFTFINYPVDIRGINMLDTGLTYWNRGIKIIKSLSKPYYASEFGGFVAFWEKTVPELRLKRLADEWNILLNNGALGANFYESHDNWAQSVVVGYNDPFKADQPDDTRGFWDHDNKPKPELRVLKKLLADLEVNSASDTINPQADQINLTVKNIRPYNLRQVILSAVGKDYEVGDLQPGEEKNLVIDNLVLGEGNSISGVENHILTLNFRYNSHAGLAGATEVDLPLPFLSKEPRILNDDFQVESISENKLTGRLRSSSAVDLVLPDSWLNFSLNGQAYAKTKTRLELPLANPYQAVSDLEISRDGEAWSKLDADDKLGAGQYYIRFRWPALKAKTQHLILAGLGTGQIEILWRGQSKRLAAHNYRENIISALDLQNPRSGELITIVFNRNQTAYVNKDMVRRDFRAEAILSENTDVQFERPRLFAPVDIILEKIN